MARREQLQLTVVAKCLIEPAIVSLKRRLVYGPLVSTAEIWPLQQLPIELKS